MRRGTEGHLNKAWGLTSEPVRRGSRWQNEIDMGVMQERPENVRERSREKLPGFWMAYTFAGPVYTGLELHVTGSEQYLHPPTTSVPIFVSQLLQVPCPANKCSGDLHTLLSQPLRTLDCQSFHWLL